MCGISGSSLSSPVTLSEDQLKKILERIRHRGPDDQGVYQDIKNNITLFHTRLAIQDVSSLGHQPMLDYDKKNSTSI